MIWLIISQNKIQMNQNGQIIIDVHHSFIHYSKINKHDNIYDLLIKNGLDPNKLDVFMFKASDYPIEKPEKYEEDPINAIEIFNRRM